MKHSLLLIKKKDLSGPTGLIKKNKQNYFVSRTKVLECPWQELQLAPFIFTP